MKLKLQYIVLLPFFICGCQMSLMLKGCFMLCTYFECEYSILLISKIFTFTQQRKETMVPCLKGPHNLKREFGVVVEMWEEYYWHLILARPL